MHRKLSLILSIIVSLSILTSCGQGIAPESSIIEESSAPPVSQSSSQSQEQSEPQPSSVPEPASSSSQAPATSASQSTPPVQQSSSSSSQQEIEEEPEELPPPPQQQSEPPKLSVSAPKPKANSTYIPADEKEVIRLFNEERVSLGLKALKTDANLTTAARIRSYEMVIAGTFAHQRPDGRNWETVLKVDVPINMREAGENLSMYEAPEGRFFSGYDWFEQWRDSPAHYENMIRDSFTHVGVGIYQRINDDGTSETIATALFCAY